MLQYAYRRSHRKDGQHVIRGTNVKVVCVGAITVEFSSVLVSSRSRQGLFQKHGIVAVVDHACPIRNRYRCSSYIQRRRVRRLNITSTGIIQAAIYLSSSCTHGVDISSMVGIGSRVYYSVRACNRRVFLQVVDRLVVGVPDIGGVLLTGGGGIAVVHKEDRCRCLRGGWGPSPRRPMLLCCCRISQSRGSDGWRRQRR